MSESQRVIEPHELAENLKRLRDRFGEFRGRL